jgi:tellurite resistance protein TerA
MRLRVAATLTALIGTFLIASPAQAAATYRGEGDHVQRIRATTTPGIARITYDGDGYFSVWGLDRSGKERQLLASATEAYTGTTVYNAGSGERLAGLKITADGPWTIKLLPLSKARSWSIAKSGEGSDVLRLSTPSRGFRVLRIRYQGDGYFSVWALDARGRRSDLIASHIGAYKGTRPLPAGTKYAVVTADGPWSIVRG